MPTDAAGSLATGLPASFLACVQCFELVQFGRNFHGDFTICAAKLKLCEVRLLRWGVAAGIKFDEDNEDQGVRLPDTLKRYPQDQLVEAQEVLVDIAEVFKRAKKTSARYARGRTDEATAVLLEEEEMRDGEPRWSSSYQALSRIRRQYVTTVMKAKSARDRTMWALYERNHLTNLINEVIELMRNLEELFPELLQAEYALTRAEVHRFEDEAVRALPEVAAGLDPNMSKALEAESQTRGPLYTDIETKDRAVTHFGNAYAPGEKRSGSGQRMTKAIFGGSSRTLVGDMIGYHKTVVHSD